MAEAELRIQRATRRRIRNKAAVANSAISQSVIWGERDGGFGFIRTSRSTALRSVFEKFAVGSARRVGLWWRTEGLLFPINAPMAKSMIIPTYRHS
jgi:hypothetical protein